jgi:hypothetical protein
VLSSCGGVELVVHLERYEEEIEKLHLSAAVPKKTIKGLELVEFA